VFIVYRRRPLPQDGLGASSGILQEYGLAARVWRSYLARTNTLPITAHGSLERDTGNTSESHTQQRRGRMSTMDRKQDPDVAFYEGTGKLNTIIIVSDEQIVLETEEFSFLSRSYVPYTLIARLGVSGITYDSVQFTF
jgi:hypothetical protein